ncbi:hypothetical protein ACWGAN_16275 [Streptomyces sp. NPDC054945]
MNTTGSWAGFADRTAGMTAAAGSMVRPPGRERFSGTSRKPHRALPSASIGSGGFGQGPGTNRRAACPKADGAEAGCAEADGAESDAAALLGAGPNAAGRTGAAAAVTAWAACCGM